MFFNTHKQTGFTLIELLVVIAIIGVLASTVLASLSVAREKSRDAQRHAEIRSLQTALESYYLDNGTYPVTNWECSYQSTWGSTSDIGAALVGDYIPRMPVDPVNESTISHSGGLSYCYFATGYGGSGQWYMLVYTLESQDTAADASDGALTCNGVTYNYGGDDGFILTKGGDCVE